MVEQTGKEKECLFPYASVLSWVNRKNQVRQQLIKAKKIPAEHQMQLKYTSSEQTHNQTEQSEKERERENGFQPHLPKTAVHVLEFSFHIRLTNHTIQRNITQL